MFGNSKNTSKLSSIISPNNDIFNVSRSTFTSPRTVGGIMGKSERVSLFDKERANEKDRSVGPGTYELIG